MLLSAFERSRWSESQIKSERTANNEESNTEKRQRVGMPLVN
jgi:hypothetical protein